MKLWHWRFHGVYTERFKVIREQETGVHKGFTYVCIDYDYDSADDDNDNYDDDNDNDQLLWRWVQLKALNEDK